MFSLRFTLLLVAFLAIPYAIKSFLSIEPFPAVILPSGPGKSLVEVSEIELTAISYYGISIDGNWRQVDASELLHPLHGPLQRYILSDQFIAIENTNTQQTRNSTSNTLKSRLSRNDRYSDQSKVEIRELLRSRLASQEFKTSRLKILKQKVVISIPSGDTINSTLLYENIIYLD